jgi:fermentation-respiration switch protein FrsA (DUF1100 family)
MTARRAGVAAVAGLVGAWAIGCAAMYERAFGSRRLGPDAERSWSPEDLNLVHETLQVRTADGVDLLAWHLPGTLGAAVIVCPGHRGRAADVLGVSGALQRAGFSVTAFGWRGTAGSGGRIHSLGPLEQRDLSAVIDATLARTGAVPLGLLGFSMGGAVALVVGADDPRVGAVCSDSAFAAPLDVLGDGVERVLRIPGAVLARPATALLERRHGVRLAEFRPLEAIARLAPRPVLLVHGEQDASVGLDHARRLLAAAGEPKRLWVVPQAIHCGAYFVDRRRYVSEVARFLGEALGVAPAPWC